jgi:hypothetical protein
MKTKIPEELFHYCPLSSLFGIVKSNILRLTCSKYSNDPHENIIGENVLKEILKENILNQQKIFITEVIKELERGRDWSIFHTPYVFCMTKKKEDLNQWRIYADNGRGFCIGLKPAFFVTGIYIQSDIDSSFNFPLDLYYDKLYINKCIYESEKQKKFIIQIIDLFTNYPEIKNLDNDKKVISFIQYFKLITSFFKHESYKDEEEWRLVCFPVCQQSFNEYKFKIDYLTKRSVIVPYMEFPIQSTFENPLFSDIFIGSNVINTSQEIADFIQNNKANFRKLIRSKVKIQEIH